MSFGGAGGSAAPADLEAYGRNPSGFFDRIAGSAPRDALYDSDLSRQHVKTLAQRIVELEAMNIDLENRLEAQANDSIRLESEAAESQRRWRDQYEALEKECEDWRQSYSQLEQKNQLLKKQLLRTERELLGVLQKKSDFMDLARKEERERIRNEQQTANNAAAAEAKTHETTSDKAEHRPPSSLYDAAVRRGGYGAVGDGSRTPLQITPRNVNPHAATPEEVRISRVVLALSDFFGFSPSNPPRGSHQV